MGGIFEYSNEELPKTFVRRSCGVCYQVFVLKRGSCGGCISESRAKVKLKLKTLNEELNHFAHG